MHGAVVASHRFAEHLALPDFRNVPQYLLFITVVGHDQEIFRRNDSGEPFVGVPDEAFSGSEESMELFRCRTAADGQKRRLTPPAMMMQYRLLSYAFCSFIIQYYGILSG